MEREIEPMQTQPFRTFVNALHSLVSSKCQNLLVFHIFALPGTARRIVPYPVPGSFTPCIFSSSNLAMSPHASHFPDLPAQHLILTPPSSNLLFQNLHHATDTSCTRS